MKEENTYNERIGLNLPDHLRMNPFSVPKGYFNDLEQSILAQVTEQKLKDSIDQTNDGFVVPPDYFAASVSEIRSKVFVENLKDEIPDAGYTVPPNYFEDSRTRLHSVIAAAQLFDQASTEGYSVPEGYFDTLSSRIIARIKTEDKHAAHQADVLVRRLPSRKTWTQYAAAAVVALVAGVGSYWALQTNPTTTLPSDDQHLALEQISNEEIFSYLTQVTEGMELIELASFLPENTAEVERDYEVNNVQDQEIEEYLNYML